MKFLQDDQLAQWTSALTEVTIGHSRILHGRLEVYSMKRVSSDKKYAALLGEKYVEQIHQDQQDMAAAAAAAAPFTLKHNDPITKTITASCRKRSQSAGLLEESLGGKATSTAGRSILVPPPKKRARSCSLDEVLRIPRAMTTSMGDFHEQGTRRLMTDLVLTLNASFPDYDFGSTKPSDFQKMTVKKAVDRINESLNEWASEHNQDLNRLWWSVNQSIHLNECDVYKFSSPEDTSFLLGLEGDMLISNDWNEDSSYQEAVLWSFYYLFVNKHKKRILLFTCAESMRRSVSGVGEGDDDGDEVVERFVQNEDAAAADNLDFDWDPESNMAGGIPVSTA